MTRNTLLKLPECDIHACSQPVRVYVDKTNQDLCAEHGGRWSEDEKISIHVPNADEEAEP